MGVNNGTDFSDIERGPDSEGTTFTRFRFGEDEPFQEHAGERRNAEICPAYHVGVVKRLLKEIYRWKRFGNDRTAILSDTEAHQNLSFGGHLVDAPDVLGIYIKEAVLFSEKHPSGGHPSGFLEKFLISEECKYPTPQNSELVELLILMALRAQSINLEARASKVVDQYPRVARMVPGEKPMLPTPVLLDGYGTDFNELSKRIERMKAIFGFANSLESGA